jgi:hypothetical protein
MEATILFMCIQSGHKAELQKPDSTNLKIRSRV